MKESTLPQNPRFLADKNTGHEKRIKYQGRNQTTKVHVHAATPEKKGCLGTKENPAIAPVNAAEGRRTAPAARRAKSNIRRSKAQ